MNRRWRANCSPCLLAEEAILSKSNNFKRIRNPLTMAQLAKELGLPSTRAAEAVMKRAGVQKYRLPSRNWVVEGEQLSKLRSHLNENRSS